MTHRAVGTHTKAHESPLAHSDTYQAHILP